MNAWKRRFGQLLTGEASAFLWGPRQSGKSTLLRELFPDSIWVDLLDAETQADYHRRPSLLRERIAASNQVQAPVVIDEVQKVPALLDEVHWLIENRKLTFILCGSSARKLKRGAANLLGGRAERHQLFPLVFDEIPNFDLVRALNHGLLPRHYALANPARALRAYVEDYLKEEIAAEGLVRNVPSFARFFDAVAATAGGLVNYASIASDCGVDAKTVRTYFEILIDTLIGHLVPPFSGVGRRQAIGKANKFYWFDVGVAGHLERRRPTEARGDAFGRAFEHWVLMELMAHRSYSERYYDIAFWRTKSGLEVDFVLNRGEIAIECKGRARLVAKDFRGIAAFSEEFKTRRRIIVCLESQPRIVDGIEVLPWRHFMKMLWRDEVLK